MPDEVKFIDPAFKCEVNLIRTQKNLYEVAKPEFDRLRKIRNLGIIGHLSDTGTHIKHDHLVGLMRIFRKLLQQPHEYGLPKRFLWSFWCRLCFAQSGHATFAYDGEKAVLLASLIEKPFRERLWEFLSPVANKTGKCTVCNNKCNFKKKGKEEVIKWFNEMVDKFQWQRLYLWVAALKFSNNMKVSKILQQTNKKKSRNKYAEQEAYKMLLCPGCKWDKTIHKLNQLDYVVRDLAFAGTVNVQLDVDGLIASANREHPDWNLIETLDKYLLDTLYGKSETQTQSALFQRAMASLLIDNKVQLESLFGTDLNNTLTDEKMKQLLCKRRVGKEFFDDNIRSHWKTWIINTSLENDKSPYDIEKDLAGTTKTYLMVPTWNRVFVHKLMQNNRLGLSICHNGAELRPKVRAFIKVFRRILQKQYPFIDTKAFYLAIWEGLLDRKVQHALDDSVSRLGDLSSSIESYLQKAASIVKNRSGRGQSTTFDVRVKIGEADYPLNSNLIASVAHAFISSKESRDKLDITIESAGKLVWDQLLRWQSVYFGMNPPVSLITLLSATQKLLLGNVISSPSSAWKDLECYTLLEALKWPKEAVSFRIALPNLIVYKSDGSTENEYDVVSISLKEDKNVEAWIWGVTTKGGIDSKRTSDYQKIQNLKKLLSMRWGDEVRVVYNYVCKEGKQIICDIDGRQYTRV